MAPKQNFKDEAKTKPGPHRNKATVRPSGPAPKDKHARSEAPTLPPPKAAAEYASHPPEVAPAVEDGRISGMRARKPSRPLTSAATVDEVVADLSKDPRHERDDDDE